MGWFRKLRETRRPYCSALVPAAGSAVRMGGASKMLLPLAGLPVLIHTLRALDSVPEIDEIVVAAREKELPEYARLCREYGITKPLKLVRGGESRAASVREAALNASPQAVLLAVHDGARPLATPTLIQQVIVQARWHNAAAPAVPVRDTIKVVRDGEVVETPDRSTLAAVQTPQVFDAALLKAALQAALEAGVDVTDDCSAVERLGKIVYLVDGEETNLKITTPLDLKIAELILQERSSP